MRRKFLFQLLHQMKRLLHLLLPRMSFLHQLSSLLHRRQQRNLKRMSDPPLQQLATSLSAVLPLNSGSVVQLMMFVECSPPNIKQKSKTLVITSLKRVTKSTPSSISTLLRTLLPLLKVLTILNCDMPMISEVTTTAVAEEVSPLAVVHLIKEATIRGKADLIPRVVVDLDEVVVEAEVVGVDLVHSRLEEVILRLPLVEGVACVAEVVSLKRTCLVTNKSGPTSQRAKKLVGQMKRNLRQQQLHHQTIRHHSTILPTHLLAHLPSANPSLPSYSGIRDLLSSLVFDCIVCVSGYSSHGLIICLV